ncbi:MAG TPA: sugar ABC transporter ATP-binding protein [Ramlibacter sp.]|nr:sugar ABC transporter ATP-binding protein [Ramlibacter sp.]
MNLAADALSAGLGKADGQPGLAARGVHKRYGAIQALAGADFSVAPGEIVGLAGHNGAGKSTLMHILAGTVQRDAGSLAIAGAPLRGRYNATAAHARGIRCVFQELSLCANLDLAENTRIMHRGLRGLGWRRQAARLIADRLDAAFPGHGIAPDRLAGTLPIGQRQMVEIARAYTVTREPVRWVILDEPTSALGDETARQALDFIAASARGGIGAVLISHRLDDILRICQRVVVMVDGRIVANRPVAGLSRDALVNLMSQLDPARPHDTGARRTAAPGVPVLRRAGQEAGGQGIDVLRGEIVGLAGLDGHGQRDCLRQLHAASLQRYHRGGPQVAHVAGDRQNEGLFQLWPAAKNLSIGCLRTLRRHALIPPAAEAALAQDWVGKIGMKPSDAQRPVLGLSGGNQQKVLLARALASSAELVFLDDPTRGVDIATKQAVYRQLRAQAEQGRSFVWYSSEAQELTHCDRVYVFREQRIVDVLAGRDISARNIVRRSFGQQAHA